MARIQAFNKGRSIDRTVALPHLPKPTEPIISGEEESAIDVREAPRRIVRAVTAIGTEIFQHDRAIRRAIRLPKRNGRDGIACQEEELATGLGERPRVGGVSSCIDILQQGRTVRGSIALPQFEATRSVVRGKKQIPLKTG